MKIVNYEQGSQEWLDWRKNRITATEAAVLLGHSPYTTPYKGWQRKTGQIPEQAVTPAMIRGQNDEPEARRLFIEEYGIEMTPCCIESELINYLGASLDGLSPCGKYLLEVKSQLPVNGVRIDHYDQMQHAMLASDDTIELGYYVSYYNREIRVFLVKPDMEWRENYKKEAKEYWKKVIFHEAPALSPEDYRNMSSFPEWRGFAEQYVEICEKIKVFEELKESYRKELIKLCGDQNGMGSGVKVLKKHARGRIDYKEACDVLNIRDDQLEHYRKPPTSTWTIMLDQK